jgi:hypothetical protein
MILENKRYKFDKENRSDNNNNNKINNLGIR